MKTMKLISTTNDSCKELIEDNLECYFIDGHLIMKNKQQNKARITSEIVNILNNTDSVIVQTKNSIYKFIREEDKNGEKKRIKKRFKKNRFKNR